MTNCITIKNLSLRFGKNTALDNINLKVNHGEILAVFGPSGAGKTSLLQSLMGLTHYRGDIQVLGLDPRQQRSKLMRSVSAMLGIAALPQGLTISQLLDCLTGTHPQFNRKQAQSLLTDANFIFHHLIGQLKVKSRQELYNLICLSIDADILLLDEPSQNLSSLCAKQFYHRLANDFFNPQRSVIISCANIDDLENIISHIALLDRGKLLLHCSITEFKRRFTYLIVESEQLAASQALGPIAKEIHNQKTKLLFDDVDRSALASLGELAYPSINDLFVIKARGAKQ